MGQLDGKVAVITGAASGMGEAAALLFAARRRPCGAGRPQQPRRRGGGAGASAAGQRCVFQRTDVSAEADIPALVARAISEFGRLDVMFNNAGIGGAIGPLEGISVEDWDRTQAVCLRGVFLGIKHSIAPMRAQGGGAIVSTASIAGIDGYPNLHAYCAAKAGVVNLTRSASIEFAADKIRVNGIAPGGVSTPILGGGANFNKAATDAALVNAQPLPIAGQPEDIAQAALFLASDAARFITGHCLVVDGGATAGRSPARRAPARNAPARNAPSPGRRSRSEGALEFAQLQRPRDPRQGGGQLLALDPTDERSVGNVGQPGTGGEVAAHGRRDLRRVRKVFVWRRTALEAQAREQETEVELRVSQRRRGPVDELHACRRQADVVAAQIEVGDRGGVCRTVRFRVDQAGQGGVKPLARRHTQRQKGVPVLGDVGPSARIARMGVRRAWKIGLCGVDPINLLQHGVERSPSPGRRPGGVARGPR